MTLAILVLSAWLGGMQAPVIGPDEAIGFDYADSEFSYYQVTRFENQYDGGAWTSIVIPPVYQQVNGVTTYKVVPTTVTGTHTIGFRACNAVGCSDSSPLFAFGVLGAPGSVPSNVRIIPRN